MNDEQYWRGLCDLCRQELQQLNHELECTIPSEQEVSDALEHHLAQLKQSGATLEDDICEILRKLQRISRLQKQIDKRSAALREYQGELWNVTGP